jgi:hypothetical protein
MSNRREFTRDEVERKQAKAVQFLRDVVGNDDLADEVDGLSVEEYAERKRIRLLNPKQSREERIMATKQEMTERIRELEGENEELQGQLDHVFDIIAPEEEEEEDDDEGED